VNIAEPVPTSSVKAERRLALDGVPSHVATPVPSDVSPVPPSAAASAVVNVNAGSPIDPELKVIVGSVPVCRSIVHTIVFVDASPKVRLPVSSVGSNANEGSPPPVVFVMSIASPSVSVLVATTPVVVVLDINPDEREPIACSAESVPFDV
jgi:hypothetical protein